MQGLDLSHCLLQFGFESVIGLELFVWLVDACVISYGLWGYEIWGAREVWLWVMFYELWSMM